MIARDLKVGQEVAEVGDTHLRSVLFGLLFFLLVLCWFFGRFLFELVFLDIFEVWKRKLRLNQRDLEGLRVQQRSVEMG